MSDGRGHDYIFGGSENGRQRAARVTSTRLHAARSQAVLDDAFDALAPVEVKRSLEAGLCVLRQGDIFGIPTSLTTRELKTRAAVQTVTR